MVELVALITLFVAVAMSMLVIRIGTIALTMTGLGPNVASFQALSAFSGVGFTTTEAEDILADPVRRRIVSRLILVGNLGIVTIIATVVLSFTESKVNTGVGIVYMVLGVGAIVLFIRSRWFNRLITPVIRRRLSESTSLALRDYTRLLRLRGEYRVAELRVETDDWLTGDTLGDLNLSREGVLVLGIDRSSGQYIGAPGPDEAIHPGDTVFVYGRADQLQELSTRDEDDHAAHKAAVEEHNAVLDEQERVSDDP